MVKDLTNSYPLPFFFHDLDSSCSRLDMICCALITVKSMKAPYQGRIKVSDQAEQVITALQNKSDVSMAQIISAFVDQFAALIDSEHVHILGPVYVELRQELFLTDQGNLESRTVHGRARYVGVTRAFDAKTKTESWFADAPAESSPGIRAANGNTHRLGPFETELEAAHQRYRYYKTHGLAYGAAWKMISRSLDTLHGLTEQEMLDHMNSVNLEIERIPRPFLRLDGTLGEPGERIEEAKIATKRAVALECYRDRMMHAHDPDQLEQIRQLLLDAGYIERTPEINKMLTALQPQLPEGRTP